ncbi:MAG: DUF3048 domain-containing protein [Candidatus Peribacteraceae bacterium]|nr:DUF3048 domain-containing protein [Candidatus Peribacteraceae bacterium]
MEFTFWRERKKLFLVLAGIAVFLAALIGGRLFFEYLAEDSATDENSLAHSISGLVKPPVIENEILPKEKLSPLTGLEIDNSTDIKAISAMIENHPASRPQMRGLNEAGIVIEALAEGGITRFLAVFDTSTKKRVGPIRSARPYFVDWAEEFGGAFVHAGGSTTALEQLSESDLLDFDEDGEILYRDFQFLQPHNLFANLADVRETKFENSLSESWFDFTGEIPASAASISQLSLDFSLPSYIVDYVYDTADGDYKRLLGGTVHTANGDSIRPTNIIVQFTEYFPIDDAGRLELRTTGEGIAWYFSEGKFWQGIWRKSGGRTRFYDDFGNPASLNPGQTFIEILDTPDRVEVTQSGLPVE